MMWSFVTNTLGVFFKIAHGGCHVLELHTEDLNLETYREPSPITTSGINLAT